MAKRELGADEHLLWQEMLNRIGQELGVRLLTERTNSGNYMHGGRLVDAARNKLYKEFGAILEALD